MITAESIKKGRTSFYLSLLRLAILAKSLLILGPAFFSACERQVESIEEPFEDQEIIDSSYVSINLEVPLGAKAGSLDIFFFMDDRLGLLDSYQHLEEHGLSVEGLHSSGKRRMVVLANTSEDRYTWSAIRSYSHLKEAVALLVNESADSPVMSIDTLLMDLPNQELTLQLTPIMSRVTLRSISCDFHGRPYEGALLVNPKVYLTNVSSRCSVLQSTANDEASELLNQGAYSGFDAEQMRDGSLVYRELQNAVSSTVTYPLIHLYCYPNKLRDNDIVSLPTRLVIEGEINGRTYYYPIAINEDGGGVARGMGYYIDLTITRLGSINPDVSLSAEDLTIKADINDWETGTPNVIQFQKLL